MKNKYLLLAPEGMEGQASGGQAPAEQSAQAPSAPESSSGQGVDPAYLKRLEEQNLNAQQKITQFGQQSAELKRQLEQMQQAEELRKQQMLAAYGVKQDAVEPDVIDRMMQDPKYLDNLIENRVKSAVDPIKAERDRERLNANLQSEISKKATIKEQLSKEYSKDIVEQLTDFNQMFPDLSQKQQQLNQALEYGSINSSEAQKIADAIDSELYKRIQFYGGLEGVVDRQLGTMFRSNKDTLIRDAMQQERQRQLLNNRNRSMNSFSNSAPGDDLNNVGYKRRVGAARVVSN